MPTTSTTRQRALTALVVVTIVLSFSNISRGIDRRNGTLTAASKTTHVPEPITLLVLGSALVLAARSIRRRPSQLAAK